MRPACGASSPVSCPISVVLPAPFGPMMAWSSPSGTARLTSSEAVTPPKRLVSPSIASSASGMARPQYAVDAAAGIKHDEQQQWADDDLPVFGDARERLFQHEQRARADQRTDRRTHAAEHNNDDEVA